MLYQVQLLGYNFDLYENETVASANPQGLVGVAILLQMGDISNTELRKISRASTKVKYGGNRILKFGNRLSRHFQSTEKYSVFYGNLYL